MSPGQGVGNQYGCEPRPRWDGVQGAIRLRATGWGIKGEKRLVEPEGKGSFYLPQPWSHAKREKEGMILQEGCPDMFPNRNICSGLCMNGSALFYVLRTHTGLFVKQLTSP